MSEVVDVPDAQGAPKPPERVHVERHIRADRVNDVLNDPAVRRWVAPLEKGVIDISPAVSNPRNYLLMGEHGGVMFFQLAPGLYEAHTQVLPAGRGAWTLGMTRAALFWLYTKTEAYEVVTRVPRGHIGARAAAIASGLKYDFTRPKECEFLGKIVDVHIHSQRCQDWIRDADGLVERGQWFHERLHQEAKRLGLEQPMHTDDENHNRHAGAAIEMAMNDQPNKAVAFYNRWALSSRHRSVELVGVDPTVIKFDIGLLFVGPKDIEVVLAS